MSKIYNLNNFKKNKKTNNNFDIKLIPVAIGCYCFGNIGAFLVLLISRGSDKRLISFHAAQSMLFFLFHYLGQVVFQSIGFYTLTVHNIFYLIKILFIVFGMVRLVTNRNFYIPYLSDIASKLVW